MGRGIHRMSRPQSPSKGSRYGLCSLDIRFSPSEILGEVYFFGWRDNSMVVRCSQVRGEEGWYSSYINCKTISYRVSYYTLHQSSYTSIGYTSSFRERAKNETCIQENSQLDLQDDARVYKHRQVRKKYVEGGLYGDHPRFVALGINQTPVLEGMARYWIYKCMNSHLVNK